MSGLWAPIAAAGMKKSAALTGWSMASVIVQPGQQTGQRRLPNGIRVSRASGSWPRSSEGELPAKPTPSTYKSQAVGIGEH